MHKIGLEIWGSSPKRKELAAQKYQFWHDLGQLCNLIANMSGLKQDIANRKMALQSTNTLYTST